jgi:ATP-binding cassette subfamily B protein RaxB
VVLGLLLIYILIRWVSFRPFRQANEEQLIASARAQSQLLESIRGVQAVKLNNKQEMRVSTYANELVEATNKGIHIQRLSIGFQYPAGADFRRRAHCAGLDGGAVQVLEGNFSAGMLIAFTSFADQFTGRATGLIDAMIEFWMLRLHGERLADIVLTEKEGDMDNSIALPSSDTALPIEVKNLKFPPMPQRNRGFSRAARSAFRPGNPLLSSGHPGQGENDLSEANAGPA